MSTKQQHECCNCAASIVVPTYNRPQQLEGCLASLSELQYPADDFEVIVVDDGSTTPVADLVNTYADRLKVRTFCIENGGPGAARNFGAKHARGRFLAFTDDDCRTEPAWLAQLVTRLEADPRAMVGGRTLNGLTDNIWSETSQAIVDVVYAYYNRDAQEALFLASNNMAIDAQLFRDLGGFNSSFYVAAEDRELCRRWLRSGGRIELVEGALLHHTHHLSPSGFMEQHFNYGRGAWRFHQTREPMGVEDLQRNLRFYVELPGLFRQRLGRLGFRRGCTAAGLLLPWQLANAAGFAREAVASLLGRAFKPQE